MSRDQPAVLFGKTTDQSWLEGKRAEVSVRVKLQVGEHTILIHAQIVGDFGTADQAAATQLMEPYKDALTRQFSG